MDDEIALVQSKTFWAALLALVSVIAQQFHVSWLYGWASDPNTVTAVLNGIAVASTLAAIVFRRTATKQVTSLFGHADPTTLRSAAIAAIMASVIIATAPTGCSGEMQAALTALQRDAVSVERFLAADVPTACGWVKTAEADGAPILATLSAAKQAQAASIEAGVNALCANPTQQSAGANLQKLWNAYTSIRALFSSGATL